MSRTVLVPCTPSSVTGARQRLCSDLEADGLCSGAVGDAALVVSELLSNALRHAAPLPAPFPPDCVQVAWRLEPDEAGALLEISVRDGGASTLPRIARPSISALGGRGLGIVEHLAARWGTEVEDEVTTVWAVLRVPVEEPLQDAEWDDAPGAGIGTSRTRAMSG
ncbi:ATP-binding protein [Nocardiopsis composta]|uniref:Anti-sigma regulatory factor (Ser/Thr protein kinase) n=1 Tax=Nocardiopsis composta TaxID=157465 RepID=A0A7W8QNP2_9ACTN|nr:ATP-binding protein [Nocardiopsis composta]MBB5433666.1 anti-sigma regulatory factor (Ser/Thr protein kinase) [Nocardiopsis composta]